MGQVVDCVGGAGHLGAGFRAALVDAFAQYDCRVEDVPVAGGQAVRSGQFFGGVLREYMKAAALPDHIAGAVRGDVEHDLEELVVVEYIGAVAGDALVDFGGSGRGGHGSVASGKVQRKAPALMRRGVLVSGGMRRLRSVR